MTTSVPLFDPEAVPVVGDDGHLPAVDAAHLLPDALRRRFADPPQWQPEITGDARVFEREPARASVLVPLVMHGQSLSVLLTRRASHLRAHAGQVSFPGGRAEDHDADAIETALRETEEEVGLARKHVEVIGSLPTYTTITAFHVKPVVALVRSRSRSRSKLRGGRRRQVPCSLMTPGTTRTFEPGTPKSIILEA